MSISLQGDSDEAVVRIRLLEPTFGRIRRLHTVPQFSSYRCLVHGLAYL